MSQILEYYKNRDLFESSISNFFNEINFSFNLTSHMFSFIDNKLYIICYDMNFDKKINIFNITDIDNNIIFESNNISDLLYYLQKINSIKYHLRSKKFSNIIN